MPGKSNPELYKFEGQLTGQLQGPDDAERTELPITIQFEDEGACVEFHDPKGARESHKVEIGHDVARQLFQLIELFSK
jgi:hypothetical protein